jgi:hypothetical protein
MTDTDTPNDAEENVDISVEPPAKKNRLGVCSICSQNESKYTCPGCLIPFCCVECSKKHKMDTNCTGKRDSTAFVDLAKFDTKVLKSGMCSFANLLIVRL